MSRLSDLLRGVTEALEYSADPDITAITADSREVKPGTLFAALKGEKTDGAAFAAQAIAAGAAAILCDKETTIDAPVLLRAKNPRRVLAQLASAFYPAQPKHIVAVTGTDGKTSTADFTRQLWHLMGETSASMGTLGVLDGEGKELAPGTHTTPDPVKLHRLLSDLCAQKIDHVALEASSHGLHQNRLDGVTLEAAAFTNIARDHLDYHHDEESYFQAKALLFSYLLPPGKTAVLNQDDAKFPALAAICKRRGHRIIGFGKNGGEFTIKALQLLPHGQRATISFFGKERTLDIPLVGAFQAMNILAALGLVVGSGGDLEQALGVIPSLKGVPGRLEHIAQLKNGASVFIDYAHTPLALGNILRTLRPHTQKKLHVVFGCGGDRDPGKRPEMGKIASELADSVIVTDDNPRSENPELIRQAVLAKSPGAKEVAGRKEAIYAALMALKAGDVLVVAGKGHEKVQIIGKDMLPFDDAEVVREGVGELKL